MRWPILLLVALGVSFSAPAAEETPIKKAEQAFLIKDYKKAAQFAGEAVKAEPTNAEAHYLLGMANLNMRELAPAISAFNDVLKLDPKFMIAHDRRGDALLKSGKFAEAIQDYDAYLDSNPKFAPEHWRRGIALYYAKRYEDGVKQFDTHKTVNPEDVENAAWHYLCNVKVIGKEKSLKTLIDVTRDSRIPMAEIQKLYAGKLKPADVLAAAEKTKEKTAVGTSARFYANLYVGLWYEAEGDAKKAREHLKIAVEDYKIGDYMWDVGNAHLPLLKAK